MSQSRKIPFLAALFYGAAFGLPLLGHRANRVSEVEGLWIWDLAGRAEDAREHILSQVAGPGIVLVVLVAFLLPLCVLIPRLLSVPGSRAASFGRLPGLDLAPLAGLLGLTLALLCAAAAIELESPARLNFGAAIFVHALATLVLILGGVSRLTKTLSVAIVLVASTTVFLLPGFERLGILVEAANQSSRIAPELLQHLRLSLSSVALAGILGLPLAFLSHHHTRVKNVIMPIINTLQTIPSIALFGLMIAPLAALGQAIPALGKLGIRGIGNTPALIALSLYAIYPIVRYTLTALDAVPPAVLDAGRGLGMDRSQISRIIRIPLALPFVLHGFRVASIQTLGNATLAKLIGGNGLGVFVFDGLGQASSDLVLLGMALIVILTLLADLILGQVIRILTPRALRGQFQQEVPGGSHA